MFFLLYDCKLSFITILEFFHKPEGYAAGAENDVFSHHVYIVNPPLPVVYGVHRRGHYPYVYTTGRGGLTGLYPTVVTSTSVVSGFDH